MDVLDQLDSRSAARSTSTGSLHPLTLDFLAWIAREPRTYAETMEAWRTSCPRFPVWEDAVSERKVILTPRGRAALEGAL